MPSRGDATARAFLDTAASLVDTILSPEVGGAKGRSLRFPEALHWLQVQDVVRLTQQKNGRVGASNNAFHARWSHKDDFIDDVVVYTMLYRDKPDENPRARASSLGAFMSEGSLSEAIAATADGVLAELVLRPRSYLLMHLVPLLSRHAHLIDRLNAEGAGYLEPWVHGFTDVLTRRGLNLRAEWSPSRLAMAVQVMIDGFLVRHRADPDGMAASVWEGSSLVADTIITFVLGAVDTGTEAVTAHIALDRLTNGRKG